MLSESISNNMDFTGRECGIGGNPAADCPAPLQATHGEAASMASEQKAAAAVTTPPPSTSLEPHPSSDTTTDWQERVLLPVVFGGIGGAGAGLLSKHRRALGAANLCATYATNAVIVAGCYCGAREFARKTRASDPDDLISSLIGGLTSGALLGRLQGGQSGALRYSIVFAVAGTAFDYAALRLKPLMNAAYPSWKMPEWSPIRVLDEEALAAKRAREQEFYAQRTRIRELKKEDSR